MNIRCTQKLLCLASCEDRGINFRVSGCAGDTLRVRYVGWQCCFLTTFPVKRHNITLFMLFKSMRYYTWCIIFFYCGVPGRLNPHRMWERGKTTIILHNLQRFLQRQLHFSRITCVVYLNETFNMYK